MIDRKLQFKTMSPEDLELLVTRELPFGKCKGRLIADLPGNYLRGALPDSHRARRGFSVG
jgi:uncharacterized protein (DUF3820 family)